MADLPERLRSLAESLEACEWNHPLRSVEACRAAAEEVERLRAVVADFREQRQRMEGIYNDSRQGMPEYRLVEALLDALDRYDKAAAAAKEE